MTTRVKQPFTGREVRALFRKSCNFSKISIFHSNFVLAVGEWSAGYDQWVALPWFMLWLAIIKRHWASLSSFSIARSSLHCAIICCPFYIPTLIGKERYKRYRSFIVAAAFISYILHPGGGLYRDAVMVNSNEHTGLDAINLFVRLVIGSRTLFWLLLIFGYELPPLVS